MEKKNYTPPLSRVIELTQSASILNSSPGNGGGNLPGNNNDNNDNDWPL